MDHSAYLDFLQSKFKFSRDTGIAIERSDVNSMLKPHQVDIVQWACRKGRAAIFAAFGLGKSMMQLECVRLILAAEGGRGLIVLPLGVRQEFRRDAEKLGLSVTFVRRSDEVAGDGIYLTNYESVRDGKLDPTLFTVASLDEASVLRSYGSLTYQSFLTLFASVRYRFVATATPSPNRYKELIHYAGFLGVMDTGQALTRFFQRDSTKANNLTIYPHMEREFYLWLHSWAAFVQRPSDLGHDDAGYDMPEMVINVHEVRALDISGGADRDGQAIMFKDAALGLKEAASEKRESIAPRIDKALEIINAAPDDHFIIWHHLEAERHAIKKAIPEAAEIYGSLDLDERERRTLAFADGQIRIVASKPEVSGSGTNWQRHCHRAIFLGINYQFNDVIQAVHRIRRYLQDKPVIIDFIVAETEREVWRTLQAKWQEHETLTEQMSALIREHGLSTLGLEAELTRTIGVTRFEKKSDLYHVAHNDTVMECDLMTENSVDQIITSIPFGNHYEYSASYNDFGHNDDNARFFKQMDFLTPNLLRVLRPGRVACIHVKDRINFGNVTGYGMPSVEPFHADCIAHYRKHGFVYFGMVTIVTDVVRENNQTYRLGWSENAKDGTKMGVGSPEYVLLFRKLPTDTSRGYADVPVAKSKEDYTRARWQVDAHAFWRSGGNRLLTAEELAGYGPDKLAKMFPEWTLQQVYDFADHVAIGDGLASTGRLPATFMAIAPGSHHPDVWTDVNRMRTLNGDQASRNLQMHVCPLQFDIVDRLIERYSAKGETIFDPFGGLFTVPVRAMRLGRRGRAVELNAEYYRDGCRYLAETEREMSVPDLFALENAA
jgi:SAM-dependent methyltransferase